jgi:hypothetical protein
LHKIFSPTSKELCQTPEVYLSMIPGFTKMLIVLEIIHGLARSSVPTLHGI